MTFIRHGRESSFSICKKDSQIMVTEIRLQVLMNCLNRFLFLQSLSPLPESLNDLEVYTKS